MKKQNQALRERVRTCMTVSPSTLPSFQGWIRFLDIASAITWPIVLGGATIVAPSHRVSQCFLLLLVGIAVQSRIGIGRRAPAVLGGQFAIYLTILIGGSLWPIKAMDRRIELGSEVIMLGDLARLGRLDLYPGVDPGAIVRLNRSDPKRKQLSAAIREQTEYNASRSLGLCGTGATILFGGGPIGRMSVSYRTSMTYEEAIAIAGVVHFAHHLDPQERPTSSFAVTPSTNRLHALLRGNEVVELDVSGEDLAPGFRMVAPECPNSDSSCLLLVGSDAASGALRTLRIDLDRVPAEGRALHVVEDRVHEGHNAPHDAIVSGARPSICWFLESETGDVWGWNWESQEMRCVVQASEHPRFKDYRFLFSLWAEEGFGDDHLELDVSSQPWSKVQDPELACLSDRDKDGWIDHVMYPGD